MPTEKQFQKAARILGVGVAELKQAFRDRQVPSGIEGLCRNHGGDDSPETCPECKSERQSGPEGGAKRG